MKPEDFGLTVEVEEITPEQAQAYLDNNAKHREIRDFRVEKYAEKMAAGDWKLNGKVIIFDSEGTLRNGQHRLTAVIQSGKPLTSLVVRGVSLEAFT